MDMSAGDFLALFYLLKIPVAEINLKVEWSIFMMINILHKIGLIQMLGNLNYIKKQQF